MNDQRERRKSAGRMMKKPAGPFKQIDLSDIPFVPGGLTRAYSNNRYVIMIHDETPTSMGKATKVLIQNHFDKPIINHWSELQKIKNEIFGLETTAVEYYPAESELINDHNIYWLWIFPNEALPRTNQK